MRRVAIVTALAVAIGVIAGMILLLHSRSGRAPQRDAVAPQHAVGTPNTSAPRSMNKYAQIRRGTLSDEQIAAEIKRRDVQDGQWEWKTPIDFYGRTVDERLIPIDGVEIHFQWTNLSGKGTSERVGISDAEGRFRLNGIDGKRLLIRLHKPGYDTVDRENRISFEFANPFEQNYYEPNPDNPVIFQLRKKGEGADLVKKSVEVVLPGDGSSKSINLLTGKIQPNGDINVQSIKPWPPRPMSPHYDWKVSLTIPDGGFVEAHEEFPFEAPETVYEPTYEINIPATLGNAWKVSIEKTLYFTYGNPRKYGRLNLRTSANSRYVFIDYFLNPSGSRNLEPKSTPAVASKP